MIRAFLFATVVLFLWGCSSGEVPGTKVPSVETPPPAIAPVEAPPEKAPPEAPPAPLLPDAPVPPRRAEPLPVEGYRAASLAGPDVDGPWPMPVTIVLHGNFDRPEWQCDMWKKVAGFRGWVLCPRGVRTSAATLEEDRWTYKGGAKAVSKEIHAALKTLEATYPGRVTREGMVLSGFSLGAILAPGIVELNPDMFSYVFMTEGGLDQLQGRVGAMKRAGVQGIGLAMSSPAGRTAAKKLLRILTRQGFKSVFVDMRGAGHNYSVDFDKEGRDALRKLISP